MRIDVDKWHVMGCPEISIYLNGTQMFHVTEADDKEGWVKVTRPDWWEKYMTAVPTQQLYGNVEIVVDNL